MTERRRSIAIQDPVEGCRPPPGMLGGCEPGHTLFSEGFLFGRRVRWYVLPQQTDRGLGFEHRDLVREGTHVLTLASTHA
jgi:hypothetical protein